jgi:type II secretion system protein J
LTLIELIVASAMAAVLLWATSAAFKATVDTRNRLMGRTAELSELRRAHDVIARDFHSCVMPPEDSSIFFGLTNQQDQFGAGNMALAASIGEPLLASRPTSEIVIVRYVLGQDPLDRTGKTGVLYRYGIPYPEGAESATVAGIDAETRQQPLLRNVDAVTYLFYSEERRDWVETWEQETGVPLAVRMDLSMHRAGDPVGSKLETWIFQLPAAKWINEEEGLESEGEADSSTSSTPSRTRGGTQ